MAEPPRTGFIRGTWLYVPGVTAECLLHKYEVLGGKVGAETYPLWHLWAPNACRPKGRRSPNPCSPSPQQGPSLVLVADPAVVIPGAVSPFSPTEP